MNAIRPLEVLLVDDNDDDVCLLREILEMQKADVMLNVVRDSEAVIAHLNERARKPQGTLPDVTLLDINMPKRDGFEVLQDMKRDPRFLRIPVVMFSTSSREDDIVRAHREGACSYLVKPANLCELNAMLQTFTTYWTRVVRLPMRG